MCAQGRCSSRVRHRRYSLLRAPREMQRAGRRRGWPRPSVVFSWPGVVPGSGSVDLVSIWDGVLVSIWCRCWCRATGRTHSASSSLAAGRSRPRPPPRRARPRRSRPSERTAVAEIRLPVRPAASACLCGRDEGGWRRSPRCRWRASAWRTATTTSAQAAAAAARLGAGEPRGGGEPACAARGVRDPRRPRGRLAGEERSSLEGGAVEGSRAVEPGGWSVRFRLGSIWGRS